MRMTIGLAFDRVLTAAQAGAGWACTRLYEALAPSVAGYARAQGVKDADDLASEVFLAVFTRLRTFSGDESQFRSWVFTIAYRRIIDDRRRNGSRPAVEELRSDSGGRDLPTDESAEDHAMRRVEAERVQHLLDELTPDQRHVLALRVIADLSIEQVAAAVGKEPGAVKALQHRALEALRRKISTEAVSL